MKRVKPIIGCDLDDVLADFIEGFIAIAHRKYGKPVDIKTRPTSWEWDNMDITKKEINGVWDVIHSTQNFWGSLKIRADVEPSKVYDLSDATKLYFPTARDYSKGDDVAVQSARWLNDNFQIPFPTVFVSSDKGPLANALKYDYFIDDRPKNCLAVKEARPQCKVFLNEACHNQSFDLSPQGIPRVSGVNEFIDIVMRGV